MSSPTPPDRRALRERARRRARRQARTRAVAAVVLGGVACGLLLCVVGQEGGVTPPPAAEAAARQDTAGTAVGPVASAAGTVEPLTQLAGGVAPAGASETEQRGYSETEQLAPAPSTTHAAGSSPRATGSSAARPPAPVVTSTAPGTLAAREMAGTTSASPRAAAPTAASAAPAQPAQTAVAPGAVAEGNPLAGAALWVDPDSDAARAVASGGDPALARISTAPGAVWLGDWVPTGQVRQRTAAVLQKAAGSVPVLVLYAVPGRDCGGYSSGGLGGPAQYGSWVREVAAGIGDRRAVVVLEPDALAQLDCLGAGARAERTAMLRDAVGVLAGTGATTYLDAGNSGWVDAATMAGRLRDAGVAQARGFALNTSNFHRTSDEEGYGERLSALLGGSHYVVDTSRNGNGPTSGDLSWCNPRGRALGQAPTTATRAEHADAYLWVKRVGESDGDCGRGEPAAGTWWPQYAVGLARGAS